jgi:hypothetical protein
VPGADHQETRWAPVVAWGDAEDAVYLLSRHSDLNAVEVARIDPGSTLVSESLAAWASAYPHRRHYPGTKDDKSNQHDPTSLHSIRGSVWSGVWGLTPAANQLDLAQYAAPKTGYPAKDPTQEPQLGPVYLGSAEGELEADAVQLSSRGRKRGAAPDDGSQRRPRRSDRTREAEGGDYWQDYHQRQEAEELHYALIHSDALRCRNDEAHMPGSMQVHDSFGRASRQLSANNWDKTEGCRADTMGSALGCVQAKLAGYRADARNQLARFAVWRIVT